MAESHGTDGPVRAAIYTRLSLAIMGDTTKVDDQARICRELCGARDWEVAEVYCDNSKSAWQRNRKRKDWDRMLADVSSGHINAIVVYHGDRLVRQPYDLETLVNLAYGKGIRLASPTGTRDLSNDDDLFILRIEAAAACRESAATSRRKKGQYERMRRQGLVRTGGGGGRAYGFATDGVTHNPGETEVIRRAAADVIAGQSLGSVVRELNTAGHRTTAGNPFRQASLRRTLLSPRMAGLMPDGKSKAAWEPVLERAQWETLHAVLSANPVPANVGRGARYLLSGVARCGACGGPLYAGHGATSYRCPQATGCAKVRRDLRLLDAYVSRAAFNRITSPANPEPQISQEPGVAAEFANLTTARAEVEAAITDPALGGRLPLLLARLDSIDKRLAELRALAGDDARHRLLAAHRGVTWDEFCALPLQVRRSLVAACFEVTVLPASKRGPGFRTEDVQLVPR